jgi:hypothetical protein
LIATLPAPYRRLWPLAAVAALLYGLSLVTAPYPGQPVAKAAMGILLLAAGSVPRAARERAWLCAALATAVLGDVLLALPAWPPSFVLGLGAFLLTHPVRLRAVLALARAAARLASALRSRCGSRRPFATQRSSHTSAICSYRWPSTCWRSTMASLALAARTRGRWSRSVA